MVHLAAETGTAQSMSEIKRYSDANIGGTALLCDLIVNEKLPVKKIVLASSRAVYGEGNYYISTSEFAKTCPVSIYGATKLAQENILSVTGKMLGISIISLRFQNVYGVGQSLINPHTGIIPIFVQKLLKNESLSIFEKGNISRDFVYVDDAVDAIRLAIDYQEWIQDCFNVGSGRAVRLFGVAKRLKKLCHSESEIYLSSDSRLGDVKHHCANLKKINRTFGFEPKTSLDEGLKKFVAWVNNDRQDHR